jgi:bacillithiol biosynthesis deacetylase BshB1
LRQIRKDLHSMQKKIHVLAIAVHPDDAELSCAGTLIKEKMLGNTTGIIDLTRGELGTRGTPELRTQESAKAAAIMELDVRENLNMPDGFFEDNPTTQLEIVKVIRKYQPEIILTNALEDRHPDHGRAARLVATAAFLSGLRKIESFLPGVPTPQVTWRPKYVFHMIQDRQLQPDFLYDISGATEKKLEAILAYSSQFHHPDAYQSDEPQTYISKPGFLDFIIHRDKMMGKIIGVEAAEGFMTEKTIGLKNFAGLVQETT